MRVQSSVKSGSQVSSQRNHYQSEAKNGNLPSSRIVTGQGEIRKYRQPSASQERSYERPPINPRSADVYAHKNKMFYAQHKYQAPSDQEDASTNVSSRSQVRRNQIANQQIHYNRDGIHVSHTPQASIGKASDL